MTWVVSDGKAGMENQCLGLAEAVGLPFVVKRIKVRAPWKWLQPTVNLGGLAGIDPAGDALAPPWPRLLIATGRPTVAPALAIKRAAGDATFAVQIQNPVAGRGRFDLIVAPRHDRLAGANVRATLGALHRVTPQRLAAEAQAFAGTFDGLPRPWTAVLVGGTNAAFRFGAGEARSVAAQLRQVEGSLLVTPSRRTAPEAVAELQKGLIGRPHWLWDGAGPNPYFAMLGLAEAVLVTCDSVSMASEALSTGKPVHVIHLPGGSAKFARFHDALEAAGLTRRFAGQVEHWTYPVPDDTAVIAAEVRRRLGLAPA
ncbi:mitochondrial fission ELM1 family protein [Zavarzinia sp. CC-PAN008]|uniref:mitochondrial fission ELM1 family protein n=1 Tax=Zavarzinia sp. CC-PAN008 TaxID=3243332 RepID=UPI003F745737